jgi:group I intron endonuclease
VGRCVVTGKVYVGSSIKWLSRVKQHVTALCCGAHCNPYLQYAWNKHGADNFEWVLLELVESEDALLDREQHWINKLRSAETEHGYNIAYPVKQRIPSKRASEIRTDPEYSKNISDKALARWANKEFKERVREVMRKACENTDLRKLRSENATRLWEGSSHRDLVSNFLSNRWKDNAYAEERKQGTTDLWKDEEYRKKVSESVKERCNTPEYIAALRERVRQQHAKKRKERRERLEVLSARLAKCKPNGYTPQIISPTSRVIDRTGQRYGRLVVIERAPRPQNRKDTFAYWLCKCDCGNTRVVASGDLSTGNTRSCGGCRSAQSMGLTC